MQSFMKPIQRATLMPSRLLLTSCLLLALAAETLAGVSGAALKETIETVLRKFGQEVSEQGLETMSQKIEALALKYGDDGLAAVKRVGPRALQLVDDAGVQGVQAVRLLSRYGDDAAWVVAKPSRLSIAAKYGDDAAEALIKQGEIAEPLIESLGSSAAQALKTVSPQNGRRLAILAEDGTLQQIGRTDELLTVVRQYGDAGMEFIWRNKRGLAVTAALAAFLADPQPFIDGTVQLTSAVAEKVVQPVAQEVAKNANWTIVLPLLAIVAVGYLFLRSYVRQRLLAKLSRS